VDAAGGVMDCTLHPTLLGRSGQENEVFRRVAQAQDVKNSYKWQLRILKERGQLVTWEFKMA
jgi:hypothetical protein